MKDEYDFTGGVRGKFHRPGARINLAVDLDEDVLAALEARAQAEGVTLSDLVNELLRRDVGLAASGD